MRRLSIVQRIGRLIADDRGETLVESLISVLIVAASVLMLSTAIVTAANINAKAQRNVSVVDETQAKDDNDVSVTYKAPDAAGKSVLDIRGKSYTITDEKGDDAHTYYYFEAGD